jgi:amino acid adenylation domain-containing protein
MSVTSDILAERRSKLEARRTTLSALKRQKLDELLTPSERAAEQVIPRRPREEDAPLSLAQERLWFLDQLEPGSIAYNMCAPFRITGQLNLAALKQSIHETVRRHETLRTTFVARAGRPVQVISPSPDLELPIVDIARLPKAERETVAQRLILEGGDRPFDLTQVPPLRSTLLRLGDEEHILLMSLHHIIFDEWSMQVLIQDAGQIYNMFAEGDPSLLPELPIQYADFAHWQREWLKGKVLDQELSYWRHQLHDSPRLLNLPIDRPPTAVVNPKAETVSIAVPDSVAEGLMSLTQETETTLFMTLLASFQILLARYSGHDDIPVGTPVAGRRWVETEGMIGFFVNTLVMRTKLSGDPTIREVLRRVREVVLEAQTHQELPFAKLVEELRPERNLSRGPLFQVMFTFQNSQKKAAVALPGMTVSIAEARNTTSKFDLSIDMAEAEGRIYGSLEYNAELFERSTIDRLLGHYGAILEAMASSPDQRMSEVEILSAAERRQLLVDWNDTSVQYPTEQPIIQLFETRAKQSTHALALVNGDEQITYGELNRRANQLAHYLQAAGVRAEDRVAICVERSVEMIVAMLAVLKSGAAYVGLDPGYPADVLHFILDNSETCLVLAQARFHGVLPQLSLPVVHVDAIDETISCQPQTNLNVNISASNLACLIYTSGSTGKPKAVMIEHGSITDYVQTAIQLYEVSARDRVLQFSSICLDPHIEDMYPTLLQGGTLVLRNDEMLISPNEFLKTCGEQEVTLLVLPTTYWHELATDMPAWQQVSSLRLVTFGGDKALSDRVRAFVDSTGGRVRLMDTYGPTEATVIASMGEFDGYRSIGEIGIGRPLANTELYILDHGLRPAPVGVTGELLIGGVGLARGYWQRADVTAERFIPHPFAARPGERLYRTGDMARYRVSGNIEYLGRMDYQVKIRGFRVETGEVEAALSAHEAVREAVVIATEETPGEKRLVTYIVPANAVPGGERAVIQDLQSYLRKRLPDYMMPSSFVLLDALPLTPSGKINRRALPAPQNYTSDSSIPPRSPTEELLAGIWATVLGVATVGVEDNFFDLGGHSLLATRLVSRIREAFAVELPLRALFEYPNVATLAQHIEDLCRDGQSTVAPPLVAADRSATLPLSYAQQRLWFLDQLEPDSSLYNIAEVVRLNGRLDTIALERSFNELVRRHESLRTCFVETDGQPTQVILPPRPFSLTVEDLSATQPDQKAADLQALLHDEAELPFNLSAAPLLRVRLFRLAAEEHVLGVTMHHIISDAWSMNVLTRELGLLYQAYCSGSKSHLTELPLQYADYAVWQRKWLQAEVYETQLCYWRAQLSGAPPLLEIPTDRPRPVVRSHRGASQGIHLNAGTLEKLKDISRRHEVTLFMTVLAGFQALLSRWSGQDDIVVGTPVAGRTHGETEGLIGFFLNTLVLRTDFSGDPSFAELLKRVREVALEAYTHQDLPFERLVEEVQPERDLGSNPLFQVMLVLQKASVELPAFPDLTLTFLPSEIVTAKFDLTLFMNESSEGLSVLLEYSTDLFEAKTIKRMLLHYQKLLECVAGDSQRRISELEILTVEERKQLLIDWNNTTATRDQSSLLNLFEHQVELTPDACAVEFAEQQLSYRELNRRANQLAHYLRKLGVGADVRVGIMLERSFELVISVLGVLKAGGAYVPLDPTYPRERLNFMVADAQCAMLLTKESLAASLPQTSSKILCLDNHGRGQANESTENPPTGIHPDNLAYVIYTSGSTGRPKGVAMTHRALSNLIYWQLADFSGPTRTLQFASLNFDASFHEMFATWCSGGTLVLVTNELRLDASEMLRFLSKQQVERVFLPFVYLQHLAETYTERPLPLHLREVQTAGEQLQSTTQIAQLCESLQCRLNNHYGPSETHVVTAHTLSRLPQEWPTLPPIGRPIDNTGIYILDRNLEPVPVGVTGELYIGGVNVCRGYLDRPELTAEKFIPNPFSDKSNERIYRSGDLARYLSNGDIEFLGRVDHQVKIRGYRIEIGEVEATLREHPRLVEAVVSARDDARGEKQLVAYCVGQAGQPVQLEIAEVRQYLRERLPEYMVPSFFVFLKDLPVTATGKVDRRALPAPQPSDLDLHRVYVAPRTPTEEAIAAIWLLVLGLTQVGVEDNFFELGGHSLLTTQVISRIRQALAVEIPVRTLFERPTISGLAESIETILWLTHSTDHRRHDHEQGEV